MRILLFIFFLGFGIEVSPTHDVALAMFRISQSAEGLALDVTLDIQDLSTDLGISHEEINLQDVQSYLKLHTQFIFNGNKNEIQLLELKKVRDHFLLKAIFLKDTKDITDIHVHNTCLLTIPDHSNLIQIQLNEQLRDFRMHDERTDIVVEY